MARDPLHALEGAGRTVQRQNLIALGQVDVSQRSLSFTIGGMWPSSKTKKSYHPFSINYVEQDLSITDRLHNFWPKLHHDNIMLSHELEAHTLWKDEWDRHGVHYANILETLFPD